MCGIAGLVHFNGRPVDEPLLRRMCRALAHRGPDDEGIVLWPGERTGGRAAAGLGNRRLSVIDVEGGHQPIANETGDIWVVLNGEIYNHTDVRAALCRSGHRFQTRSDSEVVVHAYEQFGDAFVEHLDGMFALAIWDGRQERLVLARDRFGKKPLCYRASESNFAFASELQSLMLAPGTRTGLDLQALGDYLAYMAIPAPRTIYKDVRKLEPAHVLTADRNGVQVHRYWTLDYQPKLEIGENEAIERTRALLEAAVKKRLMSEVPLGAFLSGGLDSSAVVAYLASLSSGRVRTFSIGFEEASFNELQDARRIAEKFGCEHHEFVVRPQAVEATAALVRHFGEPYADSSAIPTSDLARLTRASVTVALTGDGGDEIFGGYGRHLANCLVEQCRPVGVLGRRWLSGDPSELRGASRIRRFVAAAAATRARRYRAWTGVFSPEAIGGLANAHGNGQDTVERLFDDVSHLDAVDAFLAVDSTFYLPTDLLPKMDITTMMYSLEARSPLLDRDLAEFAARLPGTFKVRGLTTKYILRKALAGIVPRKTLGKKKQGFAVPLAGWFRTELRQFLDDHLRPATVASAGLVNQRAVDAVIDEHQTGTADRAHDLWTLLMLELWHRQCVVT